MTLTHFKLVAVVEDYKEGRRDKIVVRVALAFRFVAEAPAATAPPRRRR